MHLTHATMMAMAGIATAALVATPPARGGERTGASPASTESTARDDKAQAAHLDFISSRALLGSEVVDRQGTVAGHVDDLIVDVRTSRITHAALSIGGWMGIGDSVVLTPANDLKWNARDRRFELRTTPEALENAPTFEASAWLDLPEDEWTGALEAWDGLKDRSADDRSGDSEQDAEARPRLVRVADMLDTKVSASSSSTTEIDDREVVVERSLEKIGEIRGVVVEPTLGVVPLAIIESGGILGVNTSQRLVPLGALRRGGSLVLHGMDAASFEAMEPIGDDAIDDLRREDLARYFAPFEMEPPRFPTETASTN